MKWVTRARIRVNRAATAWLIQRFIDPGAEFLFVDSADVAAVQLREGATGFDAPGATYPHKDAEGRCSFEALVTERCHGDSVLLEMARIVRAADFPGEISQVPDAIGLRTISFGFPLVAKDDGETMQRAAFLYDALYASLKDRLTRAG